LLRLFHSSKAQFSVISLFPRDFAVCNNKKGRGVSLWPNFHKTTHVLGH
jgi:hypothetical protein